MVATHERIFSKKDIRYSISFNEGKRWKEIEDQLLHLKERDKRSKFEFKDIKNLVFFLTCDATFTLLEFILIKSICNFLRK